MAQSETILFELGPPQRIQRRLVFAAQNRPHVIRRAIFILIAGWVPLVILTAFESSFTFFVKDLSVTARSLIAAPLLVIAEITCAKYLTSLADYFVEADYIAEQDIPKYEALLASTRRLLNALPIEIIVIALTYISVFVIFAEIPEQQVGSWQFSSTGIGGYSAAGWWNILVSVPLLLMTLYGWVWRWILWVRFLLVTSRLNLNLVPSHPDHAAGLGFLGHSLRAYSIVAVALSTIVAGRIATEVLAGVSPLEHQLLLGGTAIAIIAFFTLPLYSFSHVLLHEWHRGTAHYGELAAYLGRDFETKWFNRKVRNETDALDASDFSALTDLYQVVSNAYEMKLSPVNLHSIIALVGALLLPFIPVLLMTVPIDIILKDIAALLL